MLLANQKCQLVLLPFMQLVLVPISLISTLNYVLLATANYLCCQFLVKLPVILMLVGGVAKIICTALKFSPAGCCPLLLLVSTGYAVDHLCCWLVCHHLLVPVSPDASHLCCWLAILPIIEAD